MRGKEINGKFIVEFTKEDRSALISCLKCYYKECYDCPRNKFLFGFVRLFENKGKNNVKK